MDFIFHVKKGWKMGRIEGEILVFYDVFNWIELVNLMLGSHIKHWLLELHRFQEDIFVIMI